MFNNPSSVDSLLEEGVVTEVDIKNKLCKVRTLSGQKLSGVRWQLPVGGSTRSGDRISPTLGDQVYISYGLGYPLITGSASKLQNGENIFSSGIDTGEQLIDTGNFSESGGNVIGDQNAPKDMLVGDRVIGSSGGGLIALLRAGSVLLRSSRLAEIFISKWDDCVRIVSRNFEHFTDVSSDIVKNIKGRVYRYTGYAKSFNDGKVEDYSYHQYYGDTALAEAVKTDYQNAGALPAASNVIYKEQVTGTGGELLYRELHLDGMHDLVIKMGSVFTRIKNTNGEVTITYNDVNVIKVNATEISLKKGGDQISAVLTDSSVVTKFNGAVHTLDSTGVSSTFGGHFIKVTSGGVSFG
jgi:hypothetical protein